MLAGLLTKRTILAVTVLNPELEINATHLCVRSELPMATYPLPKLLVSRSRPGSTNCGLETRGQ